MRKTDRKRRADAWDATLSEEEKWKLFEYANSHPFPQALEALPAGTRRPNYNSFYTWLRFMRTKEAAHRIASAIASRQELNGLSGAAALNAATADAYLALANSALLNGEPEKASQIVAAATKINAAALRIKEQRNKEERLRIQRENLELAKDKFAAAEKRLEAIQDATDTPELSDAERIARIRAIFGLE